MHYPRTQKAHSATFSLHVPLCLGQKLQEDVTLLGVHYISPSKQEQETTLTHFPPVATRTAPTLPTLHCCDRSIWFLDAEARLQPELGLDREAICGSVRE